MCLCLCLVYHVSAVKSPVAASVPYPLNAVIVTACPCLHSVTVPQSLINTAADFALCALLHTVNYKLEL